MRPWYTVMVNVMSGPQGAQIFGKHYSRCLWGHFQMRRDWVKQWLSPTWVGLIHPICQGPGFSLSLSDWAGTSVFCLQALALLVLRTSDSKTIRFLWSPSCRSWNLPASIIMWSNSLLSIIYHLSPSYLFLSLSQSPIYNLFITYLSIYLFIFYHMISLIYG